MRKVKNEHIKFYCALVLISQRLAIFRRMDQVYVVLPNSNNVNFWPLTSMSLRSLRSEYSLTTSLGLLADELCEGVDGALAAVLPLGHDAVAHVLQGRVLGDVEPRAQTDARKNNNEW